MANLDSPEEHISVEERETWELAYRTDLERAVGIIVSTPRHRVDEHGNVVWGELDNTLQTSESTVEDFERDMRLQVEQQVQPIPGLPELERRRPTHRYEIPPAAQSWPELAIMLWEDVLPYLGAIDIVLSLGLGTRQLYKGIKTWFDDKNSEISNLQQAAWNRSEEPVHKMIDIGIVITQGAAATLVASDAILRYGFTDPIKVDVFPRGPPGYNDPSHPNSTISYLVRCQHGQRVFVYHLSANGFVLEHYILTGSEITPLPTPDLWHEEETVLDSHTGLHVTIGKTQQGADAS